MKRVLGGALEHVPGPHVFQVFVLPTCPGVTAQQQPEERHAPATRRGAGAKHDGLAHLSLLEKTDHQDHARVLLQRHNHLRDVLPRLLQVREQHLHEHLGRVFDVHTDRYRPIGLRVTLLLYRVPQARVDVFHGKKILGDTIHVHEFSIFVLGGIQSGDRNRYRVDDVRRHRGLSQDPLRVLLGKRLAKRVRRQGWTDEVLAVVVVRRVVNHESAHVLFVSTSHAQRERVVLGLVPPEDDGIRADPLALREVAGLRPLQLAVVVHVRPENSLLPGCGLALRLVV